MIFVEDWALIRRLVADGVPQRQVTADPTYDPTGGKESFSVWAQRYVDFKEGTIKDSSLGKFKGILNHSALPEFGSRRVDSIKTAEIRRSRTGSARSEA